MKRILFLLCLVAFGMTAQAQTYIWPTATDFASWLTTGTATGDTLTNTTTKTYIIKVRNSKTALGYSLDAVKISGTVSGYIQYFGSFNDTTYITTPYHVDTLANASGNYGYSFAYNPYTKVKIIITQAGTMKLAYRLAGLWRQN